MPETRLDIRYTLFDVTSAQRMRFVRSAQFKVILLLWLGSVLFLAAPLVLPRIFPPGPNTGWPLVVQISLAYLVTLFVLIFVTPVVDFVVNRLWHLPLVFRFTEKNLSLTVGDKPGGLHLRWGQIDRVEENKRVYILFYGAGNKFIVLPKTMFAGSSAGPRFRDLISRRGTLPAEKDAEEEG